MAQPLEDLTRFLISSFQLMKSPGLAPGLFLSKAGVHEKDLARRFDLGGMQKTFGRYRACASPLSCAAKFGAGASSFSMKAAIREASNGAPTSGT